MCACRTIPSVGLLIAVDDGSTDNTGRATRAAGAVVMRHSVERRRASTVETGVKVAAMYDRPDGPLRHILLLSPDLGDPAAEATVLIETVFARQANMAVTIPATSHEYSGYGSDVVRRLIRRKTDWNYHYPFSHQHYLTREAIDAAMPFSGRYVPEASTTVNVLHAGLSVMEIPCSFVYSGADRSLGSLNRPARIFGVVRATVSQLSHFDAHSKRRVGHEQGIGVSYPAPVSARDEAEVSDPSDTRRTEMVG